MVLWAIITTLNVFCTPTGDEIVDGMRNIVSYCDIFYVLILWC